MSKPPFLYRYHICVSMLAAISHNWFIAFLVLLKCRMFTTPIHHNFMLCDSTRLYGIYTLFYMNIINSWQNKGVCMVIHGQLAIPIDLVGLFITTIMIWLAYQQLFPKAINKLTWYFIPSIQILQIKLQILPSSYGTDIWVVYYII